MRFVVFVLPRAICPTYGNEEDVACPVAAERIDEMKSFNAALKDFGALVSEDSMRPLTRSVRSSYCYDETNVVAPSHMPADEVIGGYWILDMDSKHEVIRWMKRCPVKAGDVIEIRQVEEILHYAL